jgi:hypothetical protein
VTHSYAIATRLLLAAVLTAGLTLVVSVVSAPRVDAVANLTVNLKWQNELNDAPCGVAESSPVLFNDGGTPAVEVGDREGQLHAFDLANPATPGDPATPAPGWPTTTGATVGAGTACTTPTQGVGTILTGYNGVGVPESPPVDSTASIDPSTGNLLVDGGNAAEASDGGYYAFSPGGSPIWNQVVTNPPSDTVPNGGVQASMSVAGNEGIGEAGSLGQQTYALQTGTGIPARGWPQFTPDSVFSTAAVGDLYGTGSANFISGGATSSGFAFGTHYTDGGQLRIFNDHGGLVCRANTTEEIDSSPAVGPILAGGGYGIATGTGSFWGLTTGQAVPDDDTVKVYDTKCNQVWSQTLDGFTGGSPALADIQGNGTLAVVEGTERIIGQNTVGTVWALNSANGQPIWHVDVNAGVFGSVTTADFGEGYQDVIVPTALGIDILDGRSGQRVAQFDDGSNMHGESGAYGFQNAPLVTSDADGLTGITVAGYHGLEGGSGVQGTMQHFEVSDLGAPNANENGAWPQFHHDAQLTGFVGGGVTLGNCDRPDAAQNGYLTVASDGGIFAFGQDFCGSTGSISLNKPVVGMTAVPGGGGYWLVASDGGIFSYGDAGFYGSTGSLHLNAPVVGMAATPDGKGYWLVASDGGIFSYGDAQFYGSAASAPNQSIVGMASSPDGLGYWEVSTTGRVFVFGDAIFAGDTSGVHLNGIMVGMTPDPVTGGYWLIGSDGGVFSFGAPFFGSTGSIHLNQPVVAMQSTSDGGGYWFVASDGGIFAYGDAPFRGSMGGQPLNRPMVGMFGF